jgi:serine/threonine-protein kinase
MPDDPRVEQMLEELLNSGVTPEEACRACPELLSQVRAGWQRLRALQAEVGALFHPSPVSDGASPPPLPTAELPRIRGYEVQEVLGHGGMGVVYKAWHQRLQRPVALKMLLAGAYARPNELERFLREAETVAGLRHANIVQVHEAGDMEGRPYFTMEFVEGGSLAEKLTGTPQPAGQAAALVARVAEAVHAAHQRGIVHRDLKPGNILLTADGTPKITDFGLARRLEGAAGLTRTGEPVGTPSYMAPEQAEGRSRDVGPAADIYALGAILYELLTGRPPFRAETLRQIVSQDPVPPSRLNAAVPRDVDTICLKCLEKEPHKRYLSAVALAEDLQRFQRNEPILARPIGPLERGLRWTQRHPTGAALVATALALFGLAIGGGAWLVEQRGERRAELRSDVDTAVAQARGLRKGFHFQEARKLLEQAGTQLGQAEPDNLRQKLDRARNELDLVEDLDRARMKPATPVEGRFNPGGAEPLYQEAFARAGLSRPGDDTKAVAARVGASELSAELVAALDDWASITKDRGRRAWLLEVARLADPDSIRNQLRQSELWNHGPALAKLLRKLRVDELSPQLLVPLSRVLRETEDPSLANRETRAEAVPLLTAAQARHPEDFWLNFELASALFESGRPDEALGFCRVALALRPEASAVHSGMGVTLAAVGRVDDGIRHLRKALEIDPNFASAHSNLGNLLSSKDGLDEAIGHYQEAIRLHPTWGGVHGNLGNALRRKGRLDEAISHLEKSIRLDPNSYPAHNNLGLALNAKGRLDEAIGEYQEAIRLDPKQFVAYQNLGFALSAKGRLEEAIGTFQRALQFAPKLVAVRQSLYKCRYAAACAAIRASAEQGPQETRHGERERVGLRRKALDWLRANLELRASMLKDGMAMDLSLSAWQTDPALAAVRDQAALAKLPDAEREQWQRLWAHIAALVAADPVAQGRALAARRDWDKAADCYARALELGSTDDGHFWFEYAAVLLLSGDRPGYAKACAHMVERFSKASNMRAYHVARTCTLAPDAVADVSLPGRLAETELKAAAGQFWSLTEQGALHYRAGRFQQAVIPFEQSLRADPKPGRAVLNWLWLALTQQRLGKADEARRWLAKATAWLEQHGDGMPAGTDEELGLDLHNWLEAHVLRREAEAMVRPADPH